MAPSNVTIKLVRRLSSTAFVAALGCAAPGPALSADDDPSNETRREALQQYDPGERVPVLPSSVTDPRPELPSLAPPEAFVEFARQGSGVGYIYSLDPDTLAVRGDEVLVAIRVTSGKGAETVTFEGLDCPNDAYRIYAYGSADGTTFRPVRKLRWRSARDAAASSAGAFRKVLIYQFLCDPVRPRAPAAIRTRLRRL